MNPKFLAIFLLAAIVFVSGCTSQTSTGQTNYEPGQPVQDSLGQSIQDSSSDEVDTTGSDQALDEVIETI